MKLTATFVAAAVALTGFVAAEAEPVNPHNIILPRALQPAAGSVISTCNRPGVIALTFDDGPGANMDALINTLNQAGAKATFFVTGTLYGCIYNRASSVKKAFDAGHQIASHTWSHPDLGGKSSNEIQTEMKRLEQAIVNIIGVRPTYMRAPYLSTGGQVQNYMRSDNYRIIQTDVDSQDWNNISAQSSFQRIQQAGASGNGHIVLMHETVSTTPGQLAPLVINWAKQNNLKMVTVAECLGDSEPYMNGAGGGNRDCNSPYVPGQTSSGNVPQPTSTTQQPQPTTSQQPQPTQTQPSNPGGGSVAKWGQCGGIGYSGPTSCVSGSSCQKINDWYSQCL
ncbi:glycoside hydrolase/deacetylase [Ascobolus immersus RN42]|uniref:Glycoside hydrolase/deacetylase n=1 Tax=Ascobolus immersus RN42 TaxID=1160509 RepID=A0A3N4HGU8_ASCIM|nr:glycoside hydrolase/deacetylase [Ascobolus immersus RN42]